MGKFREYNFISDRPTNDDTPTKLARIVSYLRRILFRLDFLRKKIPFHFGFVENYAKIVAIKCQFLLPFHFNANFILFGRPHNNFLFVYPVRNFIRIFNFRYSAVAK